MPKRIVIDRSSRAFECINSFMEKIFASLPSFRIQSRLSCFSWRTGTLKSPFQNRAANNLCGQGVGTKYMEGIFQSKWVRIATRQHGKGLHVGNSPNSDQQSENRAVISMSFHYTVAAFLWSTLVSGHPLSIRGKAALYPSPIRTNDHLFNVQQGQGKAIERPIKGMIEELSFQCVFESAVRGLHL